MRAVLTWHSLDDSGSPVSVAPRVFEAQLRWLAREGPAVLPLADLPGADPAGDAVALTFDDGFANFGTVAAPLLAELGLPATLFVVSGHAGGTNAWGGREQPGIPTLPLLDWDALGRLVEAGVELGGHTRSHPHLPALPAGARAEEIQGCLDDLQARLGVRPTSFAYPYGAVDAATAATVAAAFDRAVTTELRWLDAGPQDPVRLPRLDMYYFRAPGRLERWGTRRFRWWVTARRTLAGLRARVVG